MSEKALTAIADLVMGVLIYLIVNVIWRLVAKSWKKFRTSKEAPVVA